MIDVPVQVKDALREGDLRKNYRFLVLNDDGTTDFIIDNDNLIKESVKIDERMNSGDTLKFGLCEGSSLEFQYFEWPNITGRKVQAFIDVEYMMDSIELTDENTTFTASEAGEYEIFVSADSPSFDIDIYKGGEPAPTIEVSSMNMDQTVTIGMMDPGDYLTITTAGTLRVALSRSDKVPFIKWHEIPIGFFEIKNCSRQASTGIIKATGYNKLMSDYLDADASALIQEEFGVDEYVYLTDVLHYLLSNYGVDDREYEKITAGMETSTFVDSSQFTAFQYSELYGNLGPLGPEVLRETYTVTTSTNIYLGGIAQQVIYYVGNITNIKISFTEDFDYIDRITYNLIRYWMASFSSSTYWGVIWDRFQSLGASNGSFPDYFFNITIEFKDGTVKRYGNYCTNSSGSFADLAKITLRNVNRITVSTPWCIDFGSRSGYYISPIIEGVKEDRDYSNRIYLWGDNRYYIYSDANTHEVKTARYYTPDLQDGRKLPEFYGREFVKVNKVIGDFTDVDFVEIEPASISNVTLRDLQSADFEVKCQYGQLNRETDLFSGVELNRSRLYPADNLYPATDIYPDGAKASAYKSMYSKLWADEGNMHSWRYLNITYKGLDENQQEREFIYQRIVNPNGTDDYNMSDNWLFRNLIWTTEQVRDYANAMAPKMQSLKWFPFEMLCAGLPYIETGDEIEIILGDQTYTSYVLQRQLNGIQNLQDTYINGTLDIF